MRIKGSHHILEKDGQPRKDTLKPGTENAILKQAGLK
ncbi:MAG: type II toxin-antitoxin system HicA family toxin [Candidatus Sumerlaeia bacterium]|nr:type II toxin-antitoxin system HicA family toxin [Candidatus Sumerlaeia bacterium]